MLVPMAEGASGPEQVWDLIRRADEFVKYAPNRDPNVARTRAREFLERAVKEAAALPDRAAGEALERQARVRLDDLGPET
jgi:hypothetical protein